MYKKTIRIVPALLCLYASGFGQKINIEPYKVSDRICDLPIGKLINYKDTVAHFSSFGHKMLLLDFWGVYCSTCIEQFPKEDSLQKEFDNTVQFILVTRDKKEKAEKFLDTWQKNHHNKLSLPVVCEDRLLNKLFVHGYIPHYVWIAPDGHIIAQTCEYMVNSQTIENALGEIKKYEEILRLNNFPPDVFSIPKPSPVWLSLSKELL